MIKDVENLQDIDEDLDAHYALAKDIEANETEDWKGSKGFEPIVVKLFDRFTGSLDGRGHVTLVCTSIRQGLLLSDFSVKREF